MWNTLYMLAYIMVFYYIIGWACALKHKEILETNSGKYFEKNLSAFLKIFNMNNLLNPVHLYSFIYNLYKYYQMIYKVKSFLRDPKLLSNETALNMVKSKMNEDFGDLFKIKGNLPDGKN